MKVHFEDVPEEEDWFCVELGFVKRWICTWTAVDQCGNVSEELRTEVRIIDEASPEIICPPTVTVDCQTELDPYSPWTSNTQYRLDNPVLQKRHYLLG